MALISDKSSVTQLLMPPRWHNRITKSDVPAQECASPRVSESETMRDVKVNKWTIRNTLAHFTPEIL